MFENLQCFKENDMYLIGGIRSPRAVLEFSCCPTLPRVTVITLAANVGPKEEAARNNIIEGSASKLRGMKDISTRKTHLYVGGENE